MANPYYQHGTRRADGVRDLFATIARRYDRLNDLQSLGLHRRWKACLVRLARLGPGQHALDVCCGTGDVAFALASTGARVTGLDFSPAMLDVARARCLRFRHEPAITLVQGDALALPFPEATFDAVTISYGLRNLAHLEAGLAEKHRVTRPGGRVLILDFGHPANPLWRRLYFAYLQVAVPVFGRCFAGSATAYAYILESLRHYPAQQTVAELLRQQGFVHVRITDLLGGAMAIHEAEKRPDCTGANEAQPPPGNTGRQRAESGS
ncbi:MAG: bifunctional demethylmenaquinone methyltransferase/2-methoxy-6-polyprenyl-1,4-benzoquinol methylase UbiE [Verrucomicrobiales bacterium]|nr:bifunctional demethylmenaquinone methyltransferase/2-methoxy-6-polyprenyl-1,4-benzoquinol methylase UbiE [Verrucomicrobiales bacterium]